MKKVFPVLFAVLAACLYAINIPFSKLLLNDISPTLLAGLLYFGAGIGIGVIFLFNYKKTNKEELLNKNDIKYVILMVILDIIAPILLMFGLKYSSSEHASLLNNFEIVATSLIAFLFFKEKINYQTWMGIFLIFFASFILTFDLQSFEFSIGSLFIIGATLCWGLENNCTKAISSKNNLQIVTIKGLCCGISSIIIGFIIGERITNIVPVICAIILGFFAYGLSIFLYIKAQSKIGAAKTSAFYTINPFVAALISLIIFNDQLDYRFYFALIVMLIGSFVLIKQILKKEE